MARDRFDDDDNRDARDDDYRDNRYDRRNERRPEDVMAIAKAKVKAPAILMLIAGIVTVLLLGYSVVMVATTDQLADFQKQRQETENDPKLDANAKQQLKQVNDITEQIMVPLFKFQPVLLAFSGLLALTSIVGAIKLINLSGSGWARTGAILNLISCLGGCCLIGLPAGIWVLIVLGNPDVKAAMNPRPSLEV